MSLAPVASSETRGTATGLRTEFAFILPRGYVDANGGVHGASDLLG